MAQLVSAFGSSHSTMLFSSLANWQEMFDNFDCKAPISDFEGNPRSFEYLLASSPPEAKNLLAPSAIEQRFQATSTAMKKLHLELSRANLDVLIIVGDDQREIFQDDSRPAIGIYYGDAIRNAAAPSQPASDWYTADQRQRLEPTIDRFYPCHAALGRHLIQGLSNEKFDIAAVKALPPDKFEGHAYSFIHRRYMADKTIPIVPIFLNTYYPPNQPTPTRCRELGLALRKLIESFPEPLRVGILASGGLSHFLVNETLDRHVVDAIQRNDGEALAAIPPSQLHTGSSEIRNWICVQAAASDFDLDWIEYIPAYRSKALTGVGLCFASWARPSALATGE